MKTAKARSAKSVEDPYLADLLENINEGKSELQLGKDEKVLALFMVSVSFRRRKNPSGWLRGLGPTLLQQ
jgi:hypothetical protein